jgi:hypothetical protein
MVLFFPTLSVTISRNSELHTIACSQVVHKSMSTTAAVLVLLTTKFKRVKASECRMGCRSYDLPRKMLQLASTIPEHILTA